MFIVMEGLNDNEGIRNVLRTIRNKTKWLAPLPPIIANTIIVPFVLAYVYHAEGAIYYFMLTVGIGEIISCGVLGMLLRTVLQKYRGQIFDVRSRK